MKTIRIMDDATGDNKIALIPLGSLSDRGFAILDLADFNLLDQLGVSWNWNRLPSGHVTTSCSFAPNKHVLPARVILDAGKGDRVMSRDGDCTNLRRDNLYIVNDGFAWRRDREYLRVSTKKRRQKVEIEYV